MRFSVAFPDGQRARRPGAEREHSPRRGAGRRARPSGP
jgi:hypothetical protein